MHTKLCRHASISISIPPCTTLRRCIFWLSPHRDLLRALLRFQNPSASDSTIRLHIAANRSSSHSRSKPRRSTLHQSLCAVRNRFIMNTRATLQVQPPSSLHLLTQAHPSSIDFASAHPDTRTKLRPHLTSTLTLTTSRRKKPPLPNARTKRQLVRALVDVQARAVGCLRACSIEKKDRTREMVRWMNEEARIPCALNMRYVEESSVIASQRGRSCVYLE